MIENKWGFKEFNGDSMDGEEATWLRNYAIQETGEGQDISDAMNYGVNALIGDGEHDSDSDWPSSLWLVPVHSERMADFIEFATDCRPTVGKVVIVLTPDMDSEDLGDPFSWSKATAYDSADELKGAILAYRKLVTDRGDRVVGLAETELMKLEIAKTKEDHI